jgi:hypothetical protein
MPLRIDGLRQGENGEMEEQFELRVPYIESYVPVGRRKPKDVTFWSTLPVGVLRVEAADLQPAYRIVPPERRPAKRPCVVRSFRNGLWWPVWADGVAMTPARFRARAGKGDMEIAAMLGVQTFRDAYEVRESFYTLYPYKKIVGDTRDRQWAQAQRGAAERILFCGDEVLLDAGEPIHYFGSWGDFVGPAFSNRHIQLPPWGHDRERIARRGVAYGIEEIARRSVGPHAPFDSKWPEERIEPLVERHRADGAALACARALIRHLVSRALLPSASGASLRQRFADYFPELGDQDMIDVRLCRRMLNAVRSPMPLERCKALDREIEAADEILRRLDELSPSAHDEEDDKALGALGFP